MNTPSQHPSEPADGSTPPGYPASASPWWDPSGTAEQPQPGWRYETPAGWTPTPYVPNDQPAYQPYYPPAYQAGPPGGYTPPSPPGRLAVLFGKPRTKVALAVAGALIVGAGAGVGVTAAVDHQGGTTDTAAGPGSSVFDPTGGTGTGSSNGSTDGNGGQFPQGTFPGPATGSGSQAGTSSSVSASATQSVGVVDINTVDGYQGAQAAGTGLVLTGDGEILTNNHVVDGATRISVTVVSTQRTYTAKVVGTSPTNDIAVLQLSNASGLKTANLGDSSSVSVGDTVTGVGNAGGDGGTPSAARGKITALDKTITASDESGAGAETLSGMFVTDAQIQAGDSGGPLYDSANEVIGIDTAAATGRTGTTTAGYAIPIAHALDVAKQIESGKETATIHIGYPAFLGVGFTQSTGTPTISQVYEGSPAADAGLTAGDVITSVDGDAVATYAQLHAKIEALSPGDAVKIGYTDTSGATRSTTVTLTTGPAD